MYQVRHSNQSWCKFHELNVHEQKNIGLAVENSRNIQTEINNTKKSEILFPEFRLTTYSSTQFSNGCWGINFHRKFLIFSSNTFIITFDFKFHSIKIERMRMNEQTKDLISKIYSMGRSSFLLSRGFVCSWIRVADSFFADSTAWSVSPFRIYLPNSYTFDTRSIKENNNDSRKWYLWQVKLIKTLFNHTSLIWLLWSFLSLSLSFGRWFLWWIIITGINNNLWISTSIWLRVFSSLNLCSWRLFF